MASQVCPKCGAFAPAQTAFCAFCGTALPTGGAPASARTGVYIPRTSTAAPPPAAWGPGVGWTMPTVPSAPNTSEEDRAALTSIFWAAALLIVGGIVSVVFTLGTSLSIFPGARAAGGLNLPLSPEFYALVVAAVVIELVVVLLDWSAFRRLAPVDPRFSTPSKLTFALLLALVLVALVIYPVLMQLNTASECLNTSSNQTAQAACFSGSLLGLLLLFALAGIVALIGYIGLLLGLWRLGTRYAESGFKVGAILTLIPLLNFVGAILILYSAYTARSKLPVAGAPPIRVG